jgi:hypothetical protein
MSTAPVQDHRLAQLGVVVRVRVVGEHLRADVVGLPLDRFGVGGPQHVLDQPGFQPGREGQAVVQRQPAERIGGGVRVKVVGWRRCPGHSDYDSAGKSIAEHQAELSVDNLMGFCCRIRSSAELRLSTSRVRTRSDSDRSSA